MRFNQLNLERYGRFKDCDLKFPARTTDLQIVLGANEAGKTTAMAAISDLLFGFPARSPYNFLFDYPLLRIGAVLEEDGKSFSCRRKKAPTGSLLDAEDKPIGEAPLLSLLRGQTRETFHVGFSLDQTRLRAGGQLIVHAKDDVGQAMFAAGSGMTGIAQVLKDLEDEADAIWGPRASAKRTYSIARSEFDEASRQLREAQLKPKTWSDARQARDDRQAMLDTLEDERAAKTEERAGVERLRRVGPQLLLRAQLLAKLEAASDVVVLTQQAEELAETAIVDAEAADRKRATTSELLEDLSKRVGQIIADPDVLAVAEGIDGLVDQRGAVIKGRQDLANRQAELKVARDRISEIRRDLGGFKGKPPPKLVLSRLRALARQYGEHNASKRTLAGAVASTEQSIAEVTARLPEEDPSAKVWAITPAISAAREMGKDMDQRVIELSDKADQLEAGADSALKRLSPWSGSFTDLAALPLIGEEEITGAQTKIQDTIDAVSDEVSEIRRIQEELARSRLRRESLENSGQAISVEALSESRTTRDDLWTSIRGHVCGDEQLTNPAEAAASFEQSVGKADSLADARFNCAQASAQLVDLNNTLADLQLSEDQAEGRLAAAERERDKASDDWARRLAQGGFPALAPEPFRTWSRTQGDALGKHEDAVAMRRDADRLKLQRDQARDAILNSPFASGQPSDTLREALTAAEVVLAGFQDEVRAAESDRTELGRLEKQRETDQRKLQLAEDEISGITEEWKEAQSDAGVELVMSDANAGLDLFDDLASAEDSALVLERRIGGIQADESAFVASVTKIANRLKLKGNDDVMVRFAALRQRLADGREKANALRKLEEEQDRRDTELRSATAERNAAVKSVCDIVVQCGLTDFSELAAAVEASRATRKLTTELETTEQQITSAGDGASISTLEASWADTNPDELTRRSEELGSAIDDLNQRITDAANLLGEARRAFDALEQGSAASDAAADAAQAKAEMEVLTEAYLLKRSEALLLKWSMEKYREQRQDPLLKRASALFSKLTLGRYADLKVDYEAASPRLLGMCDDGTTLVDVDAMSEGTTDQLFLALRLAALEQSIAAGIRLPFLADDLFVNFDDERSAAGFEVLAELAQSTQVLFFTHHEHLSKIAASVTKQPEIALCLPR